MKYFELVDTPELECAPRIKNWYGKFDVRDIRIDRFPQLPKMQLFTIESSEQTIFTDLILFPFLLISPNIRNVIEMYKENCFYRDIILLDEVSGESKLYYLPVLSETNRLQVKEKERENVAVVKKSTEEYVGKNSVLRKNIFWVRDSRKRHTIISLDLAESLLEREMFGIGLKEVELFLDERREGQKK